MRRGVLVVNHWGVPFALHGSVCRELEELLPHAGECYLKTDSAAQHFHRAAEFFRDARPHGYKTVCLGVTDWIDVAPELVECTKRFAESHGVDQASSWSTFPWRSTTHDAQVLEEALQTMVDASGPLLLCVNLLACRDVLFLDGREKDGPVFRSPVVESKSADARVVPTTVSNAGLFHRAFRQCADDLAGIIPATKQLVTLAKECGFDVAVTALASYAIGEHGEFGRSHMKEGTTSFFVSTRPSPRGYVDDVVHEFVKSSVENRPPASTGDYPFESVVGHRTRRVYRVNDRLYSSIDGRIHDLMGDPNETTDVRLSVAHIPFASDSQADAPNKSSAPARPPAPVRPPTPTPPIAPATVDAPPLASSASVRTQPAVKRPKTGVEAKVSLRGMERGQHHRHI
jgi:hypothetical protein